MEMPPDNVIYMRERYVERINGIKMDLGKLSLSELQLLEEQCKWRFMEAHTDLVIVRDVRERRFPGGPEDETTHETETPPEAS
jgi:hypothetical protein